MSSTAKATEAARAAALERQKAPRAKKGAAGLGARLRAERLKAKMGQAALAQKAKVSQKSVSDYESGRSTPDALTIERLAKAMSVGACWLAFGAEK